MIIDPVYEGKSMAGLIDLVRDGDIPRDSTVLYAHLGGQPALNAYAASSRRPSGSRRDSRRPSHARTARVDVRKVWDYPAGGGDGGVPRWLSWSASACAAPLAMSRGCGACSQSMSTWAGLGGVEHHRQVEPRLRPRAGSGENEPCPENAGIPGASIA